MEAARAVTKPLVLNAPAKSQIGNVGTRGEFQDSACFAPVLTIGTILTILSSGFKWPSCETSGWVCRTQIFVMLGRKLVIHRCLFLDAITGGLLARPDARLLLEKEWKRHEYLTSNSCLTDTFPSERVLQYQTSAELDISYVPVMHIHAHSTCGIPRKNTAPQILRTFNWESVLLWECSDSAFFEFKYSTWTIDSNNSCLVKHNWGLWDSGSLVVWRSEHQCPTWLGPRLCNTTEPSTCTAKLLYAHAGYFNLLQYTAEQAQGHSSCVSIPTLQQWVQASEGYACLLFALLQSGGDLSVDDLSSAPDMERLSLTWFQRSKDRIFTSAFQGSFHGSMLHSSQTVKTPRYRHGLCRMPPALVQASHGTGGPQSEGSELVIAARLPLKYTEADGRERPCEMMLTRFVALTDNIKCLWVRKTLKDTQSFRRQVATLWAAGIGLFSAASNEVKLPGNQIAGRKESISWHIMFFLLSLACSVLVRNLGQPPRQEFSLSMVLLMAKSSAES